MSDAPARSTLLIVIVALVGLALLVLVGGFAMGIAMSGGRCCGHHRSGAQQTPFVTSATEVTVDIRDYDYSPRDLTIPAGGTVTWTNLDTAPHDAVADDDTWGTDLLQKGESRSVTFNEPGVFPYHCSVHTYMKGAITVR